MAVYTIYTLAESDLTVSGGQQLSGITQGDGSHLQGVTITLNNNDWAAVQVDDSGDSSFGDSSNSQTLENATTYDGETYASGLRVEAEYSLTVQDPDGNSYTLLAFNINEPGSTSYATVEGLAFVGDIGGFPPINTPLTVVDTNEGPSIAYGNLASPLCFTKGCPIMTQHGARAVETLRVGDLVQTRDHGLQEIRWIGRRYFPASVLESEKRFRPILIRQDAFGPGRPRSDLQFSPQHRVLLSGWRVQLLFGTDEILVPVKKLMNDHSIIEAPIDSGVEYFHILFDQHEVVDCDGLETESYFLGDSATFSKETYAELCLIFPELEHETAPLPAARMVIASKETQLLKN
ncbi:Hint domain-containing protein [Loktanella agnita]|uniref:Hint domain-containing protein n=1 Tax=Loktanella agnita TaxID=287097 RepID=UPI0039860809